ncbi:putative disease resistance RPP13-like protein 3 [Castanea sativa]|uniref:putative disease resistance RPP13-like protein 3 n=1 Tax=Castanea sativa TaxID=21020 RepID=UPI003F64F2B0
MAEIVVNLVSDKLITLLSEEANQLMGLHKEIADIKDELEYIRVFLEDVDIQAASSHIEKIWVKQVLDIVECIEDVIGKYYFFMAQPQNDQQPRFKSFFKKFTHLVKSLEHQYDITLEIQDIKTSLSQIKKRRNSTYRAATQQMLHGMTLDWGPI